MNFIFKRVLSTIPVILGVICISFLLIHFVPGDPIDTMLGDNASQFEKEKLKHELGLDLPLFQQFKNYIFDLYHLDFGTSLITKRPVLNEIISHVPATLELSFVTLFFSLAIGIPMGVLAALKKNSAIDYSLLIIGMIGLSMPAFWLGPLLIWVFSLKLDLLPVSERETWGHVILPALTLSTGIIAILLRMTRTSMLEVINEDFIRTAKAKGINSFRLYFFHALLNALFPLLTIIGIILGALLTGTVIIETIFDWPGVGSLVFESIQQRDYPVVQGSVLLISIVYVLVNLTTDIFYLILNPKVSFD
jgi:ABC-type dipeptide/oligopeptide/nickel transport system permease component